jgi:hypothetical protein
MINNKKGNSIKGKYSIDQKKGWPSNSMKINSTNRFIPAWNKLEPNATQGNISSGNTTFLT